MGLCRHWDWENLSEKENPLDFVLPYLGASGLQGSISGDHQFGFDTASLSSALQRKDGVLHINSQLTLTIGLSIQVLDLSSRRSLAQLTKTAQCQI